MVKQTRQHGYLFKFDKVIATAPLLFSHLILFPSEGALDYLYEPVDNASGEVIIRFFPVYYTTAVKGDSFPRLPE